MYAHYTYSESDSANYAVINAADFSGVSSSSDITTSADFEVVGIAALAGVQVGVEEYAFMKSAPLLASLSKCGVILGPLASILRKSC